MKRTLFVLGILAVLALATTSLAQACPGCCGHGPGHGGPRFEGGPQWNDNDGPRGDRPPRGEFRRGRGRGGPDMNRLYNPQTEETLEGEIVRVEVREGRRGPGGVHLWIEADDEFIPVHLGPGRYLKENGPKLEKGDRIIVRGSRVPLRGGPAIIAKEFRVGDRLVSLRDDDGIPKWSRRNRAD